MIARWLLPLMFVTSVAVAGDAPPVAVPPAKHTLSVGDTQFTPERGNVEIASFMTSFMQALVDSMARSSDLDMPAQGLISLGRIGAILAFARIELDSLSEEDRQFVFQFAESFYMSTKKAQL